jgi:hypothetical protein
LLERLDLTTAECRPFSFLFLIFRQSNLGKFSLTRGSASQISATYYEISRKKNSQSFFSEIFREFFFQIFLAIVVPQPIWGMPTKKFGGV